MSKKLRNYSSFDKRLDDANCWKNDLSSQNNNHLLKNYLRNTLPKAISEKVPSEKISTNLNKSKKKSLRDIKKNSIYKHAKVLSNISYKFQEDQGINESSCLKRIKSANELNVPGKYIDNIDFEVKNEFEKKFGLNKKNSDVNVKQNEKNVKKSSSSLRRTITSNESSNIIDGSKNLKRLMLSQIHYNKNFEKNRGNFPLKLIKKWMPTEDQILSNDKSDANSKNSADEIFTNEIYENSKSDCGIIPTDSCEIIIDSCLQNFEKKPIDSLEIFSETSACENIRKDAEQVLQQPDCCLNTLLCYNN